MHPRNNLEAVEILHAFVFLCSRSMSPIISVAPAKPEHYESIVDYFLKGDLEFLNGMGVDPKRLPSRETWLAMLYENHVKETREKSIFYVIWHLDGKAIGHSNINKIIFGQEAYMHLHMWRPATRQRGLGLELVKRSIPYYFNEFRLKNLFCEPYALNPAPNRTLKKVGFTFEKEYETIPGAISFLQPVNRWIMTYEKFGVANY